MADLTPLDSIPDDEAFEPSQPSTAPNLDARPTSKAKLKGDTVDHGKGQYEDGSYRRRAPRNGSYSGASTNTAKTVDAALSTMDSLYSMVSLGLMFVAPVAAMQLEEGVKRTQEKNRAAFMASPALAARIAQTGNAGGTLMFVMANLSLFAGVALTAAPELAAQYPQVARLLGVSTSGTAAKG